MGFPSSLATCERGPRYPGREVNQMGKDEKKSKGEKAAEKVVKGESLSKDDIEALAEAMNKASEEDDKK
jgi:hypothetical protein